MPRVPEERRPMSEYDDENDVVPLLGNEDQPLVSMSDDQLEHTFDALALDINKELLGNARRGEDQGLEIALSILTTSDGDERIVSWGAEYGDGEGGRIQEDTVRRCQKFGLLQEGETIEVRFVRFWKVLEIEECDAIEGDETES